MKSDNKIIKALLFIALGILFIIKKASVISIAMTIIGAVFIIFGIIDYVNKESSKGVFKIILGSVIIVFGWFFVSVGLYTLAGALIVLGLMQLFELKKAGIPENSVLKAFAISRPLMTFISGICLLINLSSIVNLMFILAGILLTLDGILTFAESK